MVYWVLLIMRLPSCYHTYGKKQIPNMDSAAGGLGGCPYAPGAKGNCQTEVLVEMFHRMGIDTGIDLEKITEAGKFAQTLSTLLHQKCS